MGHSQNFSAADLWLFFNFVVVIFPTWPCPPTYLPAYLPPYILAYLPTYLLAYLPTYLPTCLLTHMPTYPPIYLPINNFLLTCPPSYLSLMEYQHLSMDITIWRYCNKIIHNHFSNIWNLMTTKFQTLMKVLHKILWPQFYNYPSILDYLMHDLPYLMKLIYLFLILMCLWIWCT